MTIRTLKGVKYLVTGTPEELLYRKEGTVTPYRVTRSGCSCPATRCCKHLTDAIEVRSDMIMEEIRAIVNQPVILRRVW